MGERSEGIFEKWKVDLVGFFFGILPEQDNMEDVSDEEVNNLSPYGSF